MEQMSHSILNTSSFQSFDTKVIASHFQLILNFAVTDRKIVFA